MKCPKCGYEVNDADYWYEDKCLKCALEEELKQEEASATMDGGSWSED